MPVPGPTQVEGQSYLRCVVSEHAHLDRAGAMRIPPGKRIVLLAARLGHVLGVAERALGPRDVRLPGHRPPILVQLVPARPEAVSA
jgi:hypothetical protein